jgi:hypothetical protein
MSLRTVEWQLRKVFGNLGVKSRKELADAVVTVGGPNRVMAAHGRRVLTSSAPFARVVFCPPDDTASSTRR